MSYKPKISPSSAKDENEEKQFSSTSELIQMHMMMASILYEEQLAKLTPDQEKCYLAFELGVIEYFDRVFFQISSDEEDSGVMFVNFLIYYANHKYTESAEPVFQLWRSLSVHGLLLKERELGFDSVNNQVNPNGSRKVGHFSGRYLKDAVGFDL